MAVEAGIGRGQLSGEVSAQAARTAVDSLKGQEEEASGLKTFHGEGQTKIKEAEQKRDHSDAW